MDGEQGIAVIGAGIIGQTHIGALRGVPRLRLAALVDPTPAAADLARQNGVPHYPSVEALLAEGALAGVIVASPNETHLPIAQSCLRAGVPVLLEKPPANSLAEVRQLVETVATTGVPVLVGHHRRHNPMIRAARQAIQAQRIGDLVVATVLCTLKKDAPYFNVPWRTRAGSGGPLHINLVHEIDLLRHFFGEVASVTAQVSHQRRSFAVEDTAAVTLRFTAGGLAALTISDAAEGPWAWETTSAETTRFPAHPVQAHFFAGSKAALSLPDLSLWSHEPGGDWTTPQTAERIPFTPGNPYLAQLEHFADVIEGSAAPMIDALDGARTMATLEAILVAAETGRETAVPEVCAP